MTRVIVGICVLLFMFGSSFVHGDSKVPCYFIFGDSLSDAGNNNNLNTNAKANYSPYGVDFRGGFPTGRFTNGLTTSDILTLLLGFQRLIPPFTTATTLDSLKGVNYASGASGILRETSSRLGDRIWLERQVINHHITTAKLQLVIRGPVSDYLKQCLYTITIGSNDYINNYFMPKLYPSKNLFTPDQFATKLIAEYLRQLQVLYSNGARKTALFGLGLIGCIPAELQMNNATQCVDEINQAVMIFNQKLKSLVDDLNSNSNFTGAKFTYIDSIAIRSAATFPPGFNVADTCCKLRSDYDCEPNVPPCLDRTQFMFMDGYHPTEVVNNYTAQTAFTSPSPNFVHPVDINTLVSY